jgi:hypothetical protein
MSKPVLEKLVQQLFMPAQNSKALGLTAAEFETNKARVEAFKRDITKIGEDFRKYSAYAIHEFDISQTTIEGLLRQVLKDAKLIESDTITASRIEQKFGDVIPKLAEYIRLQLIEEVKRSGASKRATNIVKLGNGGNSIIFGTRDSTSDNFAAISSLFIRASGLRTKSHNLAFRKLIYDFIGGITDEVDSKNRPIYEDKQLELQVRKQLNRSNAQFDKGHDSLSSNIQQAIGAMIFNNVHTMNVFDLSPTDPKRLAVAKELENIEQGFTQLVKNPKFKRDLKSYLLGEPGVAAAVIQTSLGFIRRMVSGEIAAVVNEQTRLNDEVIKKVARDITVHIYPQYSKENRSAGGALEAQIGEHFRSKQSNIGQLLYMYLNGTFSAPGLPDPKQLGGSPSIQDMSAKVIYDSLAKGTTTKQSFEGSASSKRASYSSGLPAPNTKKTSARKLPKVPIPKIEPIKIRSQAGKFVSLVNVVNLINMQLADKIRQNMGSPRLNYRTGRFAQSAQVLPASIDKDGAVRLPYTYLKKPYQTFEVGYNQGSPSRDPRVVISESIRELAIKQVTAKLRIVRV